MSGAVARKLIRGPGWRRTDFFLGVELSLAAIAAALVYAFDLAQLSASQPIDPNALTISDANAITDSELKKRFTATASFLGICFFLLLWVMSTHQDWERRPQNIRGQVVWLGGLANAVGAGLLVAFVLLVKGV
jgi:hypothetical protein